MSSVDSDAFVLHNALLRPAILHILRAAGFQATKPSVLDTLTDITARYILLLASRTVENAYSNHNTPEPDITDVRMALQDCGVIIPHLTPTEEAWKEKLRKPLEEWPERNGLRAKERMRRDAEDTADVREFLDWIKGAQCLEIRRIAGLVGDKNQPGQAEVDALEERVDYLTALKKKHSKTGEESRYQGTVLGKPADPKPIKIEGGPAESIHDWIARTQQRSQKLDTIKEGNGYAADSLDDARGDAMDTEE